MLGFRSGTHSVLKAYICACTHFRELRLAFFPCLILHCLTASAQFDPVPVNYRSGFQNNFHINADSALLYAQKLASKPEYRSFLRDAVHLDLFFYFLDDTRNKFKEQGAKDKDMNWKKHYDKFLQPFFATLSKMTLDTNTALVRTAKPIYLWSQVHKIKQELGDQESIKASELSKIQPLLPAFIQDLAARDDLYDDRIGLYAMLLYKDIADHKQFQNYADDLLTLTIKATSKALNDIDIYTATSIDLQRRAWNRYIHATANHFKANSLIKAGSVEEAGNYYQAAAEHSPDLTDLGESAEFANERLLFGNDQNEFFQRAYIDYIIKYRDKEDLLLSLTQMALRDPVNHKADLKSFYVTNYGKQKSFGAYWRGAINSGLAKAPSITIEKIDGSNYSSTNNAGKWILVDFWGTWCGPCRIEHPELQKLYLESQESPSKNLDIITIACYDTKEKVEDYMAEFRYTYPVAMDDLKTRKSFNVRGYPTKALITPEGNYVYIPFGIDWVAFIHRYIED